MSDSESFIDLLKDYESTHAHKGQLEGTVISVSDELVFLDIGYKTEGTLPVSAFTTPPESR